MTRKQPIIFNWDTGERVDVAPEPGIGKSSVVDIPGKSDDAIQAGMRKCRNPDCGLVLPIDEFGMMTVKRKGDNGAIVELECLNYRCKKCISDRNSKYWSDKTVKNGKIQHKDGTQIEKRRLVADSPKCNPYVNDNAKQCSRCGDVKPIDGNFGYDSSTFDNLSRRCKSCAREVGKELYKKERAGHVPQKRGKPAELYIADGVTATVIEHAKRRGVNERTLRNRLKRSGLSIQEALDRNMSKD